ncbi:trypsin-like peptidase domain-containing protein [Flavobacterium gilvum]|nr:trypsin-like peptidase domain-containing protein [Flavobacterium gilvum]KFC57825.1 hypothetical protein FEM08_33900 [Flavobacterium gilvum]
MIIKTFILLMVLNNIWINPIQEFSYFLFSVKDNQVHQGTGFFIEKDNQTYLVTASHNFFQDKFATQKTADFFYIRLHNNVTNKLEFLQINNNPISKSEKSKNLDINFYKVDIAKQYDLKIVKIKPNCLPTKIICYGFGVVDGNEDNPDLYLESLKPTEFKGNLKFEYNKPLRYFETNELDFDNYVVSYESGTLTKGTSGSPVFTNYSENGVIKSEFAGLIHLRNEQTKLATILRPEIIAELIDEL